MFVNETAQVKTLDALRRELAKEFFDGAVRFSISKSIIVVKGD